MAPSEDAPRPRSTQLPSGTSHPNEEFLPNSAPVQQTPPAVLLCHGRGFSRPRTGDTELQRRLGARSARAALCTCRSTYRDHGNRPKHCTNMLAMRFTLSQPPLAKQLQVSELLYATKKNKIYKPAGNTQANTGRKCLCELKW